MRSDQNYNALLDDNGVNSSVNKQSLFTFPSSPFVTSLFHVLKKFVKQFVSFSSICYFQFVGIKIGFPLTQTCVLIAAMWGILYFKEFDVRKSGYLIRFCSGILLILVGAYLLGSSG